MNKLTCAAPWRSLHIQTNGDVKSCCAGDYALGNLNNQAINDILTSQKAQDLRKTMKANGLNEKYCRVCIDGISKGYGAEREWHNNTSPDFKLDTANDLFQHPSLVDVRWNTTCNLNCNYCDEEFSSKWASLKKLSHTGVTRKYYNDVCDFLNTQLDKIKLVAMVGGEPLLLNENIKLLEHIPDTCTINLITNGSVDFNTNKVFNALAKKNKVRWEISFDNIKEKFEYVRHGGKWDLLVDNIKKISKLNGHNVGIHAVYNLYNCTNLCELKEFALDIGKFFDLPDGLPITWQSITNRPYALDTFNYGTEIIQLAVNEINKLQENYTLNNNEQTFFNGAMQHYNNIKNPNKKMLNRLSKFVDEIENINTDQKNNFYKLWPEFKI
jgi:MoaA/NifB/PqqE/SkfB family radical SAM enzyme